MVRRDFGQQGFSSGGILVRREFGWEGFWYGGIFEEEFWLEGKGNITFETL